LTDVTVICLTRHGHATTCMSISNLSENTGVPFHLVIADIGSPDAVRREIVSMSAKHGHEYLRFDERSSRQSARMVAMTHVETPYVVFADNNMLYEPGWLEKLIETQRETSADVVSPLILTRGGDIHFSAGRVVRKRTDRWPFRKRVFRPHQQEGIGRASNVREVSLSRVDSDFVESHCCLALTESMRLPGVMVPEMHNAQTMAYASYALKFRYRKRLVLEPMSVVQMVPVGFGYDLPWLCHSYMRIDWLRGSYRRLEKVIGKGPGTDLNLSLAWHAHHFKYLLLSMLEGNRLTRQDQLLESEVPEDIRGYDHDLPAEADERIRSGIMPYVRQACPELEEPVSRWLKNQPPNS